ncbi:phage holin family protein [Nocardioides halotolerans]|uniref:phage holin family protein n=1 Tax=Nocardioides halotolerans TaxID=433660 RepID=UPI0003FCBE9B|nr:phage holin family protein [Nocardioides halotolerans]
MTQTTRTPGQGDERSLGEVVGDLSTDLSTLMKQEVQLAKVELKEEVTKVGKGAGMLGGAGFAGWFVLLFLSLALTFLLDNWLPVEVAALITAGVWAIAAAVLASIGRKELKTANPQLPQTQQTLKEDVQWAKAQKS